MPAPSQVVISLACMVLVILACMTAGCTYTPASPATPAQTTVPAGNVVTIKNFAFDPTSLVVKTGTVVTWTNEDTAVHIIASDASAPAPFSSGSLRQGDVYTFTFTVAGTYTYTCTLHPTMKGTIIVQP